MLRPLDVLERWLQTALESLWEGRLDRARLARELREALEGLPAEVRPVRVRLELAQEDLRGLEERRAELEAALTRDLEATLAEMGRVQEVPPRVELAAAPDLERGRTRIALETGSTSTLALPVVALHTRAWLEDAQGNRWPLLESRIPIGRGPENDVVLLDPSLSRRHAVLEYRAGRFWVRDLGSRNGTFLNGRPLPAEGRPLRNGDRLRLGRVELRYREADREP